MKDKYSIPFEIEWLVRRLNYESNGAILLFVREEKIKVQN